MNRPFHFRGKRLFFLAAIAPLLLCPSGYALTPCGGSDSCPDLTDQRFDANDKIVSVLYEMLDNQNINWRLSFPDWGAVGSWYYRYWKELQSSANDNDFAHFRNFLDTICQDSQCTVDYHGKSIFKPVALSIYVTNDGDDSSPDWVKAQAPTQVVTGIAKAENNMQTGATCVPVSVVRPNWESTAWQEAYINLVKKFGEAFKDDPRVDSVWIASGHYGEAASVINRYQDSASCINPSKLCWCAYEMPTLFNWLNTGGGGDKSVAELYRESFGNKPIFMLITGGGQNSKELADVACNKANVGFKTNTLKPDDNMAYSCGRSSGLVQIADRFKEKCPIGYEHAFDKGSDAQTYWSLISSLAHGVDVMDLDSQEASGGTQFFGRIASLNMLNGQKLWDFWQTHAGHGFRPGEPPPSSVWILLRHWIEDPPACSGGTWANAYEPGDWEFYLYRPENTCGAFAAGTCEAGTDMGNRFNEDIPNGATEFVSGTTVGGGAGVYGAYGARKTKNNGSMFFFVDDRWSGKALGSYIVSVDYWADATDKTFALEYYDRQQNLKRVLVQKEGVNVWKNKTFEITNANLADPPFPAFSGGRISFALSSNNDGEDIFHRIMVTPKDLCVNVVCLALDECHDIGSCIPASGVCSNPAKPDNTPCSIGTCQTGACVPTSDEDGGSNTDGDGQVGDNHAGDVGGGCGCGSSPPDPEDLTALFLGLLAVCLRLSLPKSNS